MSNAAALGKVPGLVKELQDTVVSSISNIKAATDEINENKSKLVEFAKKCKDAKKDSPAECYLLVGKDIEKTDAAKKKWKEAQKKKKGKKKGAAKGKGKAKAKK